MYMEFAENALNMKLLHRNATMAVKNYNYLIASKYNLSDRSSRLPIPVNSSRLSFSYLFEMCYPPPPSLVPEVKNFLRLYLQPMINVLGAKNNRIFLYYPHSVHRKINQSNFVFLRKGIFDESVLRTKRLCQKFYIQMQLPNTF